MGDFLLAGSVEIGLRRCFSGGLTPSRKIIGGKSEPVAFNTDKVEGTPSRRRELKIGIT